MSRPVILFQVLSAATSEEQTFTLFWYVGPPAIAVLLLAAVVVWWMRRGDRAVSSRLNEVRRGQFQMPGEDEPAGPPPSPGEERPGA
jgi:hypothetical protein